MNRSKVYAWALGLLFAFQIAGVSSYLSRTVHTQAVIAAADDDAGWVVKRAIATRWWKDNGTAVYGPFFFRTIHSISYFLGNTADAPGEEPYENFQRVTHFTVLMVSMFSLAAIGLILAALITTSWAARFAIAMAFFSAFLSHAVWVEFLFRAHPDYMFALVCLAAFLATVKMLREPASRFWFRGSAILWGIAVAVKLTVALWTPAFLTFFIPPFKRAGFMLGLKYLGWMFLGYFAIGFPQTIVLDRPIRILLELNRMNLAPTSESFMGWLKTIAHQAWNPVLVLAVAVLLFGDAPRGARISRANWLRLSFFAILPILQLTTKNMLLPSEHYTIPFFIVGLALLAIATRGTRPERFGRSPLPLRLALMIALIIGAWGVIPKTLNARLITAMKCRPEFEAAYAKVKGLVLDGHIVWFDPLFPNETSNPKGPHKIEWRKSWAEAERLGITAVALNRDYAKQFLGEGEPSEYILRQMPNWRDQRAFYSTFALGNEATSPSGRVFRKVYADACERELWVSEPAKK